MAQKPHLRRGMLALGAAIYALVTVLFLLYERPGLGIAHGYYLAIICVALVTGPLTGLGAGALATGLYALVVWLNPHVPVAELPSVATAIRGVSYTVVGLTVGWYAAANRTLARRTLALMDELRALAERDELTGLPNTRAFEAQVSRRLDEGLPFILLIGHLDGLERVDSRGYDEGNDLLRNLAAELARWVGAESEVSRIGKDSFAVLSSARGAGRDQAADIERMLSGHGHRVSFGWASFPVDADTALSLYRVADERLYARRLVRGDVQTTLHAVP